MIGSRVVLKGRFADHDDATKLSGDKNMVPLIVAIIAAFLFHRCMFMSLVENKNLYRLP